MVQRGIRNGVTTESEWVWIEKNRGSTETNPYSLRQGGSRNAFPFPTMKMTFGSHFHYGNGNEFSQEMTFPEMSNFHYGNGNEMTFPGQLEKMTFRKWLFPSWKWLFAIMEMDYFHYVMEMKWLFLASWRKWVFGNDFFPLWKWLFSIMEMSFFHYGKVIG